MNEVKPRWLSIISILLVLSGLAVIYFFGFPRSNSLTPTLPSSTSTSFVPALPTLEGETEGIPTSALEPRAAKGFPAPDFLLTNTHGEQVRLSELRGQPILINFWATWCAPCRIEMPAIQARYEAYEDRGLIVLGVDFDEPLEDVQAFGEQLGLSFDLLLDPGGEVQGLYRVRGYPTSFFVGRDGIIQVQHIGVMTEGQLDDYLAQIEIGE
jgi:peroxiredoxin